MRITQLAAAAALVFGITTGASAATIVNISATSGVATPVTFQAGTYTVSWIGQAQGGAYDGWTYNTGGKVREAFDVVIDTAGTTVSVDRDNGGVLFSSYATAPEALGAVGSGPYIAYLGATDGKSSNGGNVIEHFAGQVSYTLNTAATLDFGIPDNVLWDNTGGVSLSIAAAVPEPETYALMLAGLGGLGVVARRRKAA